MNTQTTAVTAEELTQSVVLVVEGKELVYTKEIATQEEFEAKYFNMPLESQLILLQTAIARDLQKEIDNIDKNFCMGIYDLDTPEQVRLDLTRTQQNKLKAVTATLKKYDVFAQATFHATSILYFEELIDISGTVFDEVMTLSEEPERLVDGIHNFHEVSVEIAVSKAKLLQSIHEQFSTANFQ